MKGAAALRKMVTVVRSPIAVVGAATVASGLIGLTLVGGVLTAVIASDQPRAAVGVMVVPTPTPGPTTTRSPTPIRRTAERVTRDDATATRHEPVPTPPAVIVRNYDNQNTGDVHTGTSSTDDPNQNKKPDCKVTESCPSEDNPG